VYIGTNLGPALDAAGLGDVMIIMHDDNGDTLINSTNTILRDPVAASYVDAIGLHWYKDYLVNASVLKQTHEDFPDYFLFYSETCYGFLTRIIDLGEWTAAEYFAQDIMAALKSWATGWVHWNLALDMEGGPSWVGNIADSPTRVNSTAGEFNRQPHYYAMGHFSKFIPRGSVQFDIQADTDNVIQYVGFTRPDGGTTVVLFNTHSNDVGVTLLDNSVGEVNTVVPANGIQTVVWWTE
jgi:glucosylceramidase